MIVFINGDLNTEASFIATLFEKDVSREVLKCGFVNLLLDVR